MKNITKILTALLVLATASLHGQSNVTVSYGSLAAGNDGSTFGNAAGNGFDNAVKGLIAFGWSDGFDDTTSIAGMLEDFNVLGSLSFDAATPAGYNPATSAWDNDALSTSASGKEGYWLLLAGVNSFASASSATEIGIFNDDSWDVAPVGSISGDTWATAQIGNVDNVIFGSQVASGGFGTGTQFLTAAVGAVPEPSSYALLGGLFALTFVMLRRRA